MAAVRGVQKSEISQFMSRLTPLFYAKDMEGFLALQAEERQQFASQPEQIHHRLNMILIQGLMCQRDGSFTMEQEDLELVADYLFQIEDWTMYEMILLGNLYSFYDVDYVYRMGREVMERRDFYQNIGSHKHLVILAALNFWLHCAEHRDFDKAAYFEHRAKELLQDQTKIYEKTVVLYQEGFTSYQKGQKAKGIEQMQEAIAIFDKVRAPQQATYYQEHFDRFVNP